MRILAVPASVCEADARCLHAFVAHQKRSPFPEIVVLKLPKLKVTQINFDKSGVVRNRR